MSVYSLVHRIARGWAASRRAVETERLIASLPADIRKDIGWPSEIGRTYRPASRGIAEAARS